MTIYECGSCGHIEFDTLTEKCLVCHAAKDAFKENADAVKTPADPGSPTEAERKHTPKIVVVKECGLIPEGTCTDVHVRVGDIEHPMQTEHFIRYIDYYIDKTFISRVWLSPEVCHPAAALHLNVSAGTLTAVENCNVHGTWMAETQI